ncbi:MAG: hypothetical protein HRT61_16785 [Ekhidna sp.]|nr:hypothetical protein [Ekhidna sp.]
MSFRYTIRSGLPYTAAIGFEEFIPDDAEEERFYEINYAELNDDQLPIYRRMDVSAWYKLKNKNKSSISGEIGISILNVLNTNNLYSRTFSIEEDEDEEIFVLKNDRRLLGITPNVSVRLKF